MELIRKKAFARAGLIGNPSDGYHGKTISIGLGNLWAQVSLYEWEQIEIVWSQEDRSRFDSIRQLADDVRCSEDRLQKHPRALHVQPLVQGLLHDI